jgi:hypothetical protein
VVAVAEAPYTTGYHSALPPGAMKRASFAKWSSS